MTQRKFSLADIITILSALTFGFLCFLGANFLNIGKSLVWGMEQTTGCIVMALSISILLFGAAYGAKLLKRTSRNFKSSFIWEISLLALFFLLAVTFTMKSSPFIHYFTVKAQQSEIENKLQTNILQAEKMFVEYESYVENRKYLYQSTLQRVVNSKGTNQLAYYDLGFDDTSGISDASQIQTKMFSINADLFPSNYTDSVNHNGLKEIATEWLQEAKSTVSNWKPIGIVGVIHEIEKNSNDWLIELINLSKVQEQGESHQEFVYTLSFNDVKSHFTEPESPSLLSIGIASIMYVLMLLSWFVTKRDSRSTGSLTTAPYEVAL